MATYDHLRTTIWDQMLDAETCARFWQESAGISATLTRTLGIIVGVITAFGAANWIVGTEGVLVLAVGGILSSLHIGLVSIGVHRRRRDICGRWLSLHSRWEGLWSEVQDDQVNVERLAWKVEGLRELRVTVETMESEFRMSARDRERHHRECQAAHAEYREAA